MARRRINTRFLGISFTILVIAGVALLVVKKFVLRGNPQQYIAMGQQYAKAQDWDKAAFYLSRAAGLLPKDSALLVQLGDAEAHLASRDNDYRNRAVDTWRQAVQANPDCTDAWERLLDLYQQDLRQLEGMPKNDKTGDILIQYFNLVRETATQVGRLAPDNVQVQSIIPALNIRLWLLDLPIPETTAERNLPPTQRLNDDQKVNKAVVDLTRLQEKDPENAEIPLWVGRAKLRRARMALRDGRPSDANPIFAEVETIFDGPIKAHPKSAMAFYLDKCQILSLLLASDPRADSRKQYVDELHDTLDSAQATVDIKNPPQYMGIKLAWAHNLSMTDPGRAEGVYKDLIAKFPDEIMPKANLATMLKNDATRRDDALAVLANVPDAPPIALAGARRQELDRQITDAKLLRTDIQIDKYIASGSGTEKDQLATTIQSSLDALAAANGKDPAFLKRRGKFELSRRQVLEAIQTFNNALTQVSTQGLPQDNELLELAADAYQLGDQTGKAIDLLEQCMQDPAIAAKLRPHMVLAQLYLNNKDPYRAREQIKWLAERFPNSIEVIKMEIQTLDPVKDHEAIEIEYKRLPEKTPEQMTDKAQVAHQIGDDTEAIRLLKQVFTAKPTDTHTAVALVQMYLAAGQKDNAKQLLAEAMKASPTDSSLAFLSQTVNGASPEAIHQMAVAEIEKTTPDPFAREMRLAELGASENHPDDELVHLKKAEALHPTGSTVLERLFLHYLAAGQFDQAEAYLPKLVAGNVDQAHGLLFRLQLALGKRDVQTAMTVGNQLTTEFPEFANSWEGDGEAMQLAGQPEAAAQKYTMALQKQATNVKALRNLIAVSYQMGKFDDAKRYIADARQKFPQDPVYRDMEVAYELEHGDPDSVLPSLLDAVKQSPENQRNYVVAASALLRAAAVETTRGNTEAAKRDGDQGRDVLQQAVARWPDNFDFASKLAQVCAGTGDLPGGEAVIKALAQRPQWKNEPGPPAVLAQLYMAANKPDLAEAPLRDAMAKAKGKNIPELQLQLSQVLGAQGKFDEALKVLDANRDQPAILKRRLEVLLDAKRGAQAESEIQAAVKADPKNTDLVDLQIFVAFGEQKADQTLKLADEAIAANANDVAARFYRGLVRLASSDTDAAITDLTFVRDHSPRDAQARLVLAEAYARNNDLDDGTRELEAALKFAPDHKGLRLKLVQFYEASKPPRWFDAEQIITDSLAMPQYKNDADFLHSAAMMWLGRGENEKAVANIRAAMNQLSDKSPLIHDYLTILLASKNYDLLLQESNPLVANPAKCPWWVFDLRGRAEARNGDTAGAIKDFNAALDSAGAERGHATASAVANDIAADMGVDKAIELVASRAQNSLKWKLVAIPLYDRKGDRPTAIALAESAMGSFSSFSPAEQDELLSLSGSLYLTSDPPAVDKAIPLYQQILARHPDNAVALNNLACLLAEMKTPAQPTEALKYIQKAFDAQQKIGRLDPMIYDTQGWVLILAGQVDDGINVLHQVIDKADFPDAHYHLAEGYLRKQRPEDAQRELQNARDLITKATSDNHPADAATKVLQGKINSAVKRANQMIQAKAQAQAAPSVP
jgi:tetratricopeptide (TPR) repeat protein